MTSPVTVGITAGGESGESGVRRITYTTDGTDPTTSGTATVVNAATASVDVGPGIDDGRVGRRGQRGQRLHDPQPDGADRHDRPERAEQLRLLELHARLLPRCRLRPSTSRAAAPAASRSLRTARPTRESGVSGYTYPALGTGFSHTARRLHVRRNRDRNPERQRSTRTNNASLSSSGTSFTAQGDFNAPTSSRALQHRRLQRRLVHGQPGRGRHLDRRRDRRVGRQAHQVHDRRHRPDDERHRDDRQCREREPQRDRARHNDRQVDRRGQRRQRLERRRRQDVQARHDRPVGADELHLLGLRQLLLPRHRHQGLLPERRQPAASTSRRAARRTRSPPSRATRTRRSAPAGRNTERLVHLRARPPEPTAATSRRRTARASRAPARPSPHRPTAAPASSSLTCDGSACPGGWTNSSPMTAGDRGQRRHGLRHRQHHVHDRRQRPGVERHRDDRQQHDRVLPGLVLADGQVVHDRQRRQRLVDAVGRHPGRHDSADRADRLRLLRPDSRRITPAPARPSTSATAAPAASPSPRAARPTRSPASRATTTRRSAAGRTRATTTPSRAARLPGAAPSRRTTPQATTGTGTSFTAQADGTAPSSSALCNTAACTGGWYGASPVTVAISATDGGAGVKRIKVTTDGTDPTTSGTATTFNAASGSVDVAADGTTTVKWVAEDNVGNVSPSRARS